MTHDIAEAFKLGTRLIVFDKIRDGEEAADSAATITYDLPLRRLSAGVADLASASVSAADAFDRTVSILGGETNQEAGETS